MIDYCMDEEDLAGLVLELRSKHYHDSEWCKASPKSPWFEADAYRITKAERLPMERDLAQLKYYIKFSVNKLGNILLFFRSIEITYEKLRDLSSLLLRRAATLHVLKRDFI